MFDPKIVFGGIAAALGVLYFAAEAYFFNTAVVMTKLNHDCETAILGSLKHMEVDHQKLVKARQLCENNKKIGLALIAPIVDVDIK